MRSEAFFIPAIVVAIAIVLGAAYVGFNSRYKNNFLITKNESLLDDTNKEVGDFATPFQTTTPFLYLVILSQGNIELDQEKNIYFVSAEVSPVKPEVFKLVIGDTNNKVFFAKKTKSDANLPPEYKHVAIESLRDSGGFAQKKYLVGIPLMTSPAVVEDKPCNSYCVSNRKKIALYSKEFSLFGNSDETTSLFSNFIEKKEFGPVMQVLELED